MPLVFLEVLDFIVVLQFLVHGNVSQIKWMLWWRKVLTHESVLSVITPGISDAHVCPPEGKVLRIALATTTAPYLRL